MLHPSAAPKASRYIGMQALFEPLRESINIDVQPFFPKAFLMA